MGKKLIVINRLSPERIAAISEAVPGSSVESYDSVAAAVPHVSDADALAVWGFTDIRPLLEAAPHIKWVHSLSDGVEKLLCPPLLENPIALTNSRGIHDKPVAEHIMALLLAWTRKIPDAVRSQDKHEWKRLKAGSVYGKTTVIAGFGGIGRAAAERAKSFGIKIIAVKKHRSDELFADQVYTTAELDQVLPKADYIICALPATEETAAYFKKEHFAMMKPSSLFINIARGSIIDENGLIESLKTGHPGGAALDVFMQEPLPPDHPLWTAPNVLITPHMASMVPDFWDKLLHLLTENFAAFSRGDSLINQVDKTKGY